MGNPRFSVEEPGYEASEVIRDCEVLVACVRANSSIDLEQEKVITLVY